jgi:outer membrane murein-binding lipoprotein Lpp
VAGQTDKPASNTNASLGCGTLILIAIIVALFSGRGRVNDLETQIGDLQAQVERLEAKIDSLNARLSATIAP